MKLLKDYQKCFLETRKRYNLILSKYKINIDTDLGHQE